MEKLIKYISIIIAIIMSYFIIGNAENFEVTVTNDAVTMETQSIEVIMENKTGSYVGGHQITGVQKKIDDEWVTVSDLYILEIYSKGPPLFTETRRIGLEAAGVDGVGEYRVVVEYDMFERDNRHAKHYTTYAYFNVVEAE